MATVKSSTIQIAETAQDDAASVTSQAILATSGNATAVAVNKLLILAPPVPTSVTSSTVQIAETDADTVDSVTAQVILTQVGGSQAQAVAKTLILQEVATVEVSNVKLEVIGESTITPDIPGQRVTWWFN